MPFRFAMLFFMVVCASAATIITPDSFGGPFCLSPAFGPAACALSDEYKDGGLHFSWNVGTAVFEDPPYAWGGINGNNVVDLISPVNGWIVMPGTLSPGAVSYISVEAGWAAAGSLTLDVYDIYGNLLGSRVNGLDGTGPHGRTLITLSIPGIHFFSVYGGDTFGVDQIELGEITPAGAPIPEPGTFALLCAGLGSLILFRRPKG